MEKTRDTVYQWTILLVVLFGTFMVSLDMSIVNLAISKMMQAFNSNLDQIQWVLSAYTLALGITVPVTGYLNDRFGTKKIFGISLAMFTLGSFLCGISWNTASIIVFRIIQGLGGGLIIPLAMTLLMDTFDKGERGTALGVFGIANMVAPAVGPTLGGYIIQNLAWRLVFFINIPIGVIGTILALTVLRETEHKLSRGFDLLGFLTSSVSIGCLLYVLGKGNVDWGDFNNVILMIIGSFSLLMFIVNELMLPEPMLNLRLLKNYTYCMSNIILNVAVLVLFAGVFLVPIFLQQLEGLNPQQTGMVLFPEAITTAISLVIASKLTDRLGARIFAVAALVFLAFNSYSMSRVTLETSTATITLLLMVRGLGVGFLMAPVQLVGLNAVPKEMTADASALLSTVKQIGSAVGITLITSVMQQRSTLDYANLAGQVNTFNPNSVDLFKMLQGLFLQNGTSAAGAKTGAVSLLYSAVVKQATMQALNDTMLVITAITIMIILPTLLLKGSERREGEAAPPMPE
ncbi:multidrug export protein EmrB [Peptococcaceae bacterium CEB3]|nr:multidrug export protein EmrB [Peptococcaceae bacterium CEB3]